MTGPQMMQLDQMALDSDLVRWAANAEAAAGIARALVGTAFIPNSLVVRNTDRNKSVDIDATVAQITAALLTGQELGLGPMAALRSIFIVKGTPGISAAALRGILQAKGHGIWVIESTPTRAIVRAKRRGDDFTQEATWTMDRAKRLKLAGMNNPDGNWVRQPQNMLLARATAEAARWIAGDALLGMPLIAEELEDGDSDTPPPAAALESPPAPRRRAARTRRASNAGATSAASGGPALALAAPAEDTQEAADTGPPGDGERPAGPPEAPPTPGITGDQRAAIQTGMRRLGITKRADILAKISAYMDKEITSSNQLSRDDASTVLDRLTRDEARQAAQEAQAAAEAEGEDPGGWPPDEPQEDAP